MRIYTHIHIEGECRHASRCAHTHIYVYNMHVYVHELEHYMDANIHNEFMHACMRVCVQVYTNMWRMCIYTPTFVYCIHAYV